MSPMRDLNVRRDNDTIISCAISIVPGGLMNFVAGSVSADNISPTSVGVSSNRSTIH